MAAQAPLSVDGPHPGPMLGTPAGRGGGTTRPKRQSLTRHMSSLSLRSRPAQDRAPTQQQLERLRAGFLADAVVQFNIKAKNGIQRLVDTKIISAASPDEIANFLFNTAGLSKRRIGEFLGKAEELNSATLVAYLRFFDFTGMDLDEALRVFLLKFRLPGEAQQIDRLMEKFAGRYHSCNPGRFDNEDVAYVLAFSLIMLNTDLHSTKIPQHKKMTQEGFLANNRGINNGGDVPAVTLTAMFNRIRDREIRMEEADLFESEVVTFIGARHAGWLHKAGNSVFTSWKKYWFVLNDHCLYYFASPHDQHPRCIIPLASAQVQALGKRDISISMVGGAAIRSVKIVDGGSEQRTRQRYVFRAANDGDRKRWLTDLQSECQLDPTVSRSHGTGTGTGRSSNASNATTRTAAAASIGGERPEHEPLDVELHSLPPPIYQGWMKKRGLDRRQSELRRRYFVLCDLPSSGVVLFYYGSREMAQKMIETGVQTQKGHIDLSRLNKVNVNHQPNTDEAVLELVTADRVWEIIPENERDFEFWFRTLSQSANKRPLSSVLENGNGAAAADEPSSPSDSMIALEKVPPSPSVTLMVSPPPAHAETSL